MRLIIGPNSYFTGHGFAEHEWVVRALYVFDHNFCKLVCIPDQKCCTLNARHVKVNGGMEKAIYGITINPYVDEGDGYPS